MERPVGVLAPPASYNHRVKNPSTHYETLGVPASASASQIRAAYRALARQFHPDVSRAEDAQARFAAIAAAYEVLSDAERRSAYDHDLRAGAGESHVRSGRAAGGHYTWTNVASPQQRVAKDESDFEELWATFFAGRAEESTRRARGT